MSKKQVGKRRRLRRSFTLIELLVVISIISILFAMLTKAFGLAREKTRMTACAGNLRQIGIAIHGYANEYDDFLPYCARLNSAFGLPGLRQAMQHQLSTPEIYHCPSDSGTGSLFADVGTSYEWNTLINGTRIDRTTFVLIDVEIWPPILGDAEIFHHGLGRNFLYPDAHVSRSMELLIHE